MRDVLQRAKGKQRQRRSASQLMNWTSRRALTTRLIVGLAHLSAAACATFDSCNPFSVNNTASYSPVAPTLSHYMSMSWRKRAAKVDSAPHAACIHTLGVEWNSLGVSFPDGWNFSAATMRESLQPYYLEGDSLLSRRLAQCMLHFDYCTPQGWELNETVKGCSALTSKSASVDSIEASSSLQSLHSSGVAFLNHEWGFGASLQLNGGELKSSITAALDQAHSSDKSAKVILLHQSKPNGMEQLINLLLEKVGPTVEAYMGHDAELTSYCLMRIPAKSTGFASSLWHHDRCGKRLKAFIYLNRVDNQTHATQIALGSHRTFYYSYGDFAESRFRDSYIQKSYKLARIFGDEGEGFLFDTNTVHRASLNRFTTSHRDAIVFEFNNINKLNTLSAISQNGNKICIPSAGAPIHRHVRDVSMTGPQVLHRQFHLRANSPDEDSASSMEGVFELNRSRYDFSAPECVVQALQRICPIHGDKNHVKERVCLPIEPVVPTNKLRTDEKGKRGHLKYVSWLHPRTVVYKNDVLKCSQRPRRRVYIDLGANAYWSSVELWFLRIYPEHQKFDAIYAFECDPAHAASFLAPSVDRRVHFFPNAVWKRNETLLFDGWGQGSHLTTDSYAPETRKRPVQAIDIAEFLRRTVHRDDYVVVKMDVEGAEFEIVPHLLASHGVPQLIDEMFVETHLRKPMSQSNGKARTSEDEMNLVRSLREAGIYAHQWK